MHHHGELVDPSKIKRVPLMTVEGYKDDITGIGQTEAALDLCTSLPDSMKAHHLQEGVGHYGVFNGSRFRNEILPKVRKFMRSHQGQGSLLKRVLQRVA
jgi:poly(3-hydroxybutyrate) depolymerase